jgi:hypothetical protein
MGAISQGVVSRAVYRLFELALIHESNASIARFEQQSTVPPAVFPGGLDGVRMCIGLYQAGPSSKACLWPHQERSGSRVGQGGEIRFFGAQDLSNQYGPKGR